MTIAPAPSINVILPTGTATGPWNTGWTYADPADVLVFIETAGARGPSLNVDVDFTLTATDPRTNGGDVALSPSAVPAGGWTADHRLVLARRTVRRQGVALPDAEGHKPRATERALDHAMRIAQEDQDANDRALRLPPGMTGEIAWSSVDGERFVSIGADGVPRAVARPDDFETFGKLNKTADNLYDEGERAAFRAGVGLARATPAEARDEAVDDVSMTPKAAFEAVRVVVEYVNIRETRFAGGAKVNGVDDDAPAIQAAIDYLKPYAVYEGQGIPIQLGRGNVRVDSASIDLTDAHGVRLVGGGRGVTQLRGSGNRPVVKWDNTVALPLSNAGVQELTIFGPGESVGNGDGILGGANNNCILDVRVWNARRAIALANSWQTLLIDPRVDGQGGIASQDGIVWLDGDSGVVENALIILGGSIQGVTRYGARGESVSGSKVYGLEVVGCGAVAAYIGDSPSSKPLKWFSWFNGLFDTSPQLLTVRRGTSAVAHFLHFSSAWVGYAYAANGTGVEFIGIEDFAFEGDMIVNTEYGLNIQDCVRGNITAKTIADYDRLVSGGVAAIINNTTDSTFRFGTMKKAAGSPSTTAIVEQGSSARNTIMGANADGLISVLNANGTQMIGCAMPVSGARWMMPERRMVVTKAQLPTAGQYWRGREVHVSDGGPAGEFVPAYCDGTNWRRAWDGVAL